MNPLDPVKARLIYAIVGSSLFIYLGWYLFSTAEKQRAIPANIVEIIGIAAIVFFGITALIAIKKYFT